MRSYLATLIVIIAAISYGCADPAANKPKATVGNAQPEANTARSGAIETLVISPGNSKVEFVASKVTRSHQGSFKKFSGTIDLIPNSIRDSRVTIDIETGSVETDEPQLTGHLKTTDFFEVAKYPKATFISTKIEPASTGGSNYMVTGNLELHGVKKSITFPATIEVTPEAAAVDAEFAINRKDFAIVYAGKADDLIRDEVVIKLDLRVVRK